MAESPSHRFGQVVGDLLEEIMLPQLDRFCKERGLYLDRKGQRATRTGKKLTWTDRYQNNHDLDFVIEKNGTADSLGRPVAFIEAAWRRYTKHSKNKAQEIQGAILPIAEKYSWDKPFLGAVLAGLFTEPSLAQMRSSGFEIVLFPYESIVSAFATIGLDVAFNEATEQKRFANVVAAIEKIKATQPDVWEKLKTRIWQDNYQTMENFLQQLERTLDRVIDAINIFPLSGAENQFQSIGAAMEFIKGFAEDAASGPFRKYEILVRYSNGDRVEASFTNKQEALRFLKYVAA